MAVGEHARVKPFGRLVTSGCFAVTINTKYLSANLVWALGHSTIVCVASGHIQETIARIEPDPATVVRA